MDDRRAYIIQILDAFVAAGFNFIDTADVYAKWVPGNQGGESETIIGNWLKKSGKRLKCPANIIPRQLESRSRG